MKVLVCRHCGEEFDYKQGKPGFINECEDCLGKKSKRGEEIDVERVGGNMIWNHKTAPEIEIKKMKEAIKFNQITSRRGTVCNGVIMPAVSQMHHSCGDICTPGMESKE